MSLNRDTRAHSAPCCFGLVGECKPGASNSDTYAAAPEKEENFSPDQHSLRADEVCSFHVNLAVKQNRTVHW